MINKGHRKVYIIGICGVTTAPIAKMFLDLGWAVAGSDQGYFPPMSEYLKRRGISFKAPYCADNLTGKPDLVVIGGNALVVNPKNPEYLKAKKLGCEVVDYPEVLKRYIIKINSIVITGTYGKTTITALVAWILEKAGYNPSFMIGGLALNFPDGVRKTNSLYSVVEGDEHPTLNFSPEPKFMHLRPKFALVTAAEWDHLNVFFTERAFVNSFKAFIKLIPKDGALFVCLDGKNIRTLIKEAVCDVITYSLDKEADFNANDINFGGKFITFRINGLEIESPLLGEHNVLNVLGAIALTSYLGVKPKIIQEAVSSFKGIKRRLELTATINGIVLYDDLAHSAIKIRETLKAVRAKHKNNRIFAVFDPHASSFRDRRSLNWYRGIFDSVDQVLIAKISIFKKTPRDKRVLGTDIVKAIGKSKPNVQYFPKDDKLIEFIIDQVTAGDVVVFMSSGGFRGVIEKTRKALDR